LCFAACRQLTNGDKKIRDGYPDLDNSFGEDEKDKWNALMQMSSSDYKG